jgi:hypothetical protein
MIDSKWIKKDETPQSVFNPLRVDFIDKIRDDNNVIREYKVRSMEIETFPAYLADRIRRDLITAIKNERKQILNQEEENKIAKEIDIL